jgi:hypothetical protein
MNNNNFDYLLPKITKNLGDSYLTILADNLDLNDEFCTSPLLNLTIGVFVGSLINILEAIKKSTKGEIKLIENIELAKNTIIKSIEDLPFISKVEFT